MFKKLLFICFIVLSISCQTSTSKPKIEIINEDENLWLTKVEDAMILSEETGKPIFAFFTGKVWCHWCKKLENEILSKEAFISFAKENLILLELDFPRGSRNLPKNQITLARKFEIRGYPTVILMDAKANILGKTGYERISPEGYVAQIQSMIKY
jgi:protein disulfide-isomerase